MGHPDPTPHRKRRLNVLPEVMMAKNNPAVPVVVDNDEVYNKWHPMKEDYNSVQNLLAVDSEDPLAFNLGVKTQKFNKLSDVPCQFYRGVGSYCWKGPTCPYKHELVKVHKSMDLGTEAVHTIISMDDKPLISPEASFDVWVTHVVSPHEFYVMPISSLLCLCEGVVGQNILENNCPNHVVSIPVEDDKAEDVKADPTVENLGGFEAYKNFNKSLNTALSRNQQWRFKQSASYIKGELVAVNTARKEPYIKKWERAEVLECNIRNATAREIPWYKVQLVDLGTIIKLSAQDMCTLPGAFTFLPPMAYKCSLDVTSLRFFWHKRAIDTFTSVTSPIENNLMITVKKTPISNGHKVYTKTRETIPYIVELFITGKTNPKEHYFPPKIVSEMLWSKKQCILMNKFPYRPVLSKYIGPLLADPKPLSKECIKMEKKRARKILVTKLALDSKYVKREVDDSSYFSDEGETIRGSSSLEKDTEMKELNTEFVFSREARQNVENWVATQISC